MKKTKIELEPKCCSGDIQLAVTNRSELIPCCYLDTPESLKNQQVKKLVENSKISDYESIDDILRSETWIEFEEMLLGNGPFPATCVNICKKRSGKDAVKLERFKSSQNPTDVNERKH